MQLNVAPAAIEGVVIGEHGDSEVVAFSNVRIGGLPLASFAAGKALDLAHVAEDVRNAAYQIIGGKGHTSFGVATAIVRICEAVIRDERAVLPVSTFLSGEFGISELYLSLPCILGGSGIERILMPDLNEAEVAALQRSAATVRAALQNLG